MVKIPDFSLIAPNIRLLLSDGRAGEARRLVVAALRAGDADPEVQWIAAELLDPPAKRRGGQRKHAPLKWDEIGHAVDDEMANGLKKTPAQKVVAERMSFSEKYVRDAYDFYAKIMAASADA